MNTESNKHLYIYRGKCANLTYSEFLDAFRVNNKELIKCIIKECYNISWLVEEIMQNIFPYIKAYNYVKNIVNTNASTYNVCFRSREWHFITLYMALLKYDMNDLATIVFPNLTLDINTLKFGLQRTQTFKQLDTLLSLFSYEFITTNALEISVSCLLSFQWIYLNGLYKYMM